MVKVENSVILNGFQPAIDAAAQLIEQMKRSRFVDTSCYEFYGHRDKGKVLIHWLANFWQIGNTICPGDPLYQLWGTWENWHRNC